MCSLDPRLEKGRYFPLILATKAGAATRNPIGLVLVGGIVIGTLFVLFVAPSISIWVAQDRKMKGENPEICCIFKRPSK